MKKVTLWFLVSDKVADEFKKGLTWGQFGNAVENLKENSEEYDCLIDNMNI